jgi:hypothetical protein
MSSTKETEKKINRLAGKPAEPSLPANVSKFVTAYYTDVQSIRCGHNY